MSTVARSPSDVPFSVTVGPVALETTAGIPEPEVTGKIVAADNALVVQAVDAMVLSGIATSSCAAVADERGAFEATT